MANLISNKLLEIDPEGYSPVTDACHLVENYAHVKTSLMWNYFTIGEMATVEIKATFIAFLATFTKKELIMFFTPQENNVRYRNSCSGEHKQSTEN